MQMWVSEGSTDKWDIRGNSVQWPQAIGARDGRSARASVQGDEIGSDTPVIPCITNSLVNSKITGRALDEIVIGDAKSYRSHLGRACLRRGFRPRVIHIFFQ